MRGDTFEHSIANQLQKPPPRLHHDKWVGSKAGASGCKIREQNVAIFDNGVDGT